MGLLDGKVAAVTGSTSGSGRAVARRFVQEGAEVFLLARGAERLKAEEELLGPKAHGIATDIGDPASVGAAFAQIEGQFGKLDVLVNNAAIYRPCLVEDLSDFDIERTVRTNLLGTVYTNRAAIPLLRAAGGGDIVNTSSESTLDPFPMLSMYVATKAAIEAFGKVLLAELQAEDIRVTTVIQGVAGDGEGSTDWAWEDDKSAQAFQIWTERGYLSRIGGGTGGGQTVDDIADTHLYIVTRPRGQRLDVVHVRAY
jgi:NAD(P)-dependent dehydrogenase (short-subunit alcohol dehydrogenase family)